MNIAGPMFQICADCKELTVIYWIPHLDCVELPPKVCQRPLHQYSCFYTRTPPIVVSKVSVRRMKLTFVSRVAKISVDIKAFLRSLN